ncbi:hypothetical protein LCGC14_1713950, partial [marine sediment metagenome]
NYIPSYAKISLTTSGYLNNVAIGMSETKLKEKISEIIPENCIEVDYAFKDISEIAEDELFIKYLKKLNEREYSEEKVKKMKELIIKSMMRMKL